MVAEREPALFLKKRSDGTYEPRLAGDTLADDIVWTDDVPYGQPAELPIYWEGKVKRLPVILSQAPGSKLFTHYIAHSVAWRYINEVRDAAGQGPEQAD